MRIPAFLLALLFSSLALAQSPDARLRQLEAELARVRQEQQSVFQQFQILQTLQRNEGMEADPTSPLYQQGGQIPNYDDAVKAKQEREYRLKNYSEELKRLSDRYQALESRAGPLMEQIRAQTR